MSNSRIFQASYPAERMRGARLVTDFRDAATMLRDGWNSFGSPTYYKGGGVILNGTSQYLTYPLSSELSSTTVTIHYELYPVASLTTGYFLDTPATNRCLIGAVGGGNWGCLLGGTTILTTANANVTAVEVVGGRNLLTISKAPGAAAQAWLNGSALTNMTGITAPSGVSPTTAYIGKLAAVGLYTAFKAGRLYIGHHTSTLAEHLAYWNRTMWNWEDRAVVDLQLGIGQYDPTAKLTLDSSGHDNHATLGDGAGTGEPTQGKGFMTFDGANDYLSNIANPAGTYTVLGLKDIGAGWVFFSNNDLTHWTPIFTSGGFTGKLARLMVLQEAMNTTALLDAERKFISVMGAKI